MLDPLTGSWDEHATLADTLPGAGLAALAGVSGEELREANGGCIKLRWGEKQYELPQKYTTARWEKSAETETPILDADGNGRFYRRMFGKGEVWLNGIALGNLNSSGVTIGDDFRNENGESSAGTSATLILDIAAKCGVASEFICEDKLHAMTLRLPEGGELLLVSNLSNDAASAKILSRVRKNLKYKGLCGTGDVTFSQEGEARFTLPPCGSCVLKRL